MGPDPSHILQCSLFDVEIWEDKTGEQKIAAISEVNKAEAEYMAGPDATACFTCSSQEQPGADPETKGCSKSGEA